MQQQKALFFSVIRSSDTTLLGLFRATLKKIMIVVPRLYHNPSTILRGNDVVLNLGSGMLCHPLKIASSVRSGAIPRASGTCCQLYYNGDVHHTAADGSGSLSIITLHYQVEKSQLGKKKISGNKS